MEKILHHSLGLLLLGLLMCSVQTEAMRPNCSAIAAEEKVGCVLPDPKKPNGTVCLALHCCWNPAETNNLLKCFTKRGGSCMPYSGNICHTSLNTTLSTYRNTPRFFDNKFGALGTESFLSIVTTVTNTYVTNNEKCRYILRNMFCQYILQPCYQDNTVIEYCKEDCEVIFKDCSDPLNQVIGAVKFLVQEKGIDFVHTGLPDCSRLKPYEYFANKPNKTCIKTGFFNYSETTAPIGPTPKGITPTGTTPTPPGDDDNKLTAAIGTTPTSSADNDNKLLIILPILVVGLLFIVL